MNDTDKEHIQTEIEELSGSDEFKNSSINDWVSEQSFDSVQIGDHIKYNLNSEKKNGIVVSVDPSHSKLTVIRYCNQKKVSKEDVICQNFHEIQLQKAIYGGPTYSPLSVVHRATARLDEENYGSTRNDEANFPLWCMTGSGGLLYLNQPKLREMEVKISSVRELKRGDHMMFKYTLYSHHAIVMSTDPETDQIEVIHFTRRRDGGSSSSSLSGAGSKAVIKRERIAFLMHVGKPKKVVYREIATSPVELVVHRAEQIMGKPIKYNLLTSNCEDLAAWCKTGVWVSNQVRRISLLAEGQQQQEPTTMLC